MIPMFTAKHLGPRYGIKVNQHQPLKAPGGNETMTESVMITAIARQRLESSELRARTELQLNGYFRAVSVVEGLPGYRVKIIPVTSKSWINGEPVGTFGRFTYTVQTPVTTWKKGTVIRDKVVSRATMIQKIAEHLETQG